MKYIRKYRMFESKGFSLDETLEEIEMMVSDMEDYGWEFQVYSTSPTYNGDNTWSPTIEFNVMEKSEKIIDVEVIAERVDQVLAVMSNIKSSSVTIDIFRSKSTSMCSLEFKKLDDFKISNLIDTDDFKEYLFSIKDWGMDQWLEDMMFSHKSGGDIVFKSNMQYDDFEVYIPISDIDDDVRLDIYCVSITFKLTDEFKMDKDYR